MVLLIIHSTNVNMKLLMKLTSLLLIETLSGSDYIMVNIANTSCTDNVISAKSLEKQLIERCIAANLDVTFVVGVNLNAFCQEINR